MGGCKLKWLNFSIYVNIPNIHIVTLKWKKPLKINVKCGLCNDQWIKKFHMKKTQLEIVLIYMLRKKFEMHPKMIMLWTFGSIAHFKPFKSP